MRIGTANDIIKDEKLKRLLKEVTAYSTEQNYTEQQVVEMLLETWKQEVGSSVRENHEESVDEMLFRQKAKKFLVENKEVIYKCLENLHYYEDIFVTMYEVLKEQGVAKLKVVKEQYIENGYTIRYADIIPEDIYEGLYKSFNQNFYVDVLGIVRQGKPSKCEEIVSENNHFKMFANNYLAIPVKLNMLALMVTWIINQQQQ